VDGRVAYLESRLDRTESRVGEVGEEVREQTRRNEKSLRGQLADAIAELQQVQVRLDRLTGDVARYGTAISHIEERMTALSAEVAAIAAVTETTADTASADVDALRWDDEAQAYEAARAHFEDEAYQEAVRIFQAMLSRWPDGELAPNVYFWLGEVAYRQAEPLNAIDRYLTVIERFPESNKIPAALYKLALSLEQLGERPKAKSTLKELVRRFPEAAQADVARERLEREYDD